MKSFGIRFWLQWVATSTILGLVLGGMGILLGTYNLYLWILIVSGFALGGVQAIILEWYTGNRIRLQWTLCTGVGWIGAFILVFFGTIITGAGGGLNDTDVRGCNIAICAVAGLMLGALQAVYQTTVDRNMWIALNGFAWAIAAICGGIVGFALYEILNPTIYVQLDEPHGLISIAGGMVTGMTVYGMITGIGMIGLCQLKTHHTDIVDTVSAREL